MSKVYSISSVPLNTQVVRNLWIHCDYPHLNTLRSATQIMTSGKLQMGPE